MTSSSASGQPSVASTSAPTRAAAMLGTASPQPGSRALRPPGASPSSCRGSATPLRHSTDQYGAIGAHSTAPSSGSSADSRDCSSRSAPPGSSTRWVTRSSSGCHGAAIRIDSTKRIEEVEMADAAPQQVPGLDRTDLQQHDLSAPGWETVQNRVRISDDAPPIKHWHPGEEIIYVIAGELEYEIEGESPRRVKAGEALMVPAEAVHSVKNVGDGPGE